MSYASMHLRITQNYLNVLDNIYFNIIIYRKKYIKNVPLVFQTLFSQSTFS